MAFEVAARDMYRYEGRTVLSTAMIIAEGRDGLVDFIVPLEKLVPTDRGWIGLFVSGTHEGQQIGFRIVLAPGLRPGFLNGRPDESASLEGGVLLEAEGDSSNEWLRCVAEAWGMSGPDLTMADQVAFTSFATHGDPQNLRKEEIRFKLFSGSEAEGDYAEWFLHLNAAKGYAGFVEKDANYRENLVFALCGIQTGEGAR